MKSAIYPVLYVIVSAITTVVIDGLVTNLPVTLVLFLVTSIAILYFHLLNYRKLDVVYRSFLKTPGLVVLVNIALAVTWAATYFGIAYLNATIYNIIYFSITAVLATLMGQKRNFIQASLLIVTLAVGVFVMKLSLTGALIGVLAGIAGFSYRKWSFALSQKASLSSSQVLTIRFWILWLVLLCVAPLKIVPAMTVHLWLLVLLTAFTSFILQNWLNQQGIQKAGVKRSTLILSWTPTVTLACQIIVLHQFHWSWLILALVCQVLLFLNTIHEGLTKWIRK